MQRKLTKRTPAKKNPNKRIKHVLCLKQQKIIKNRLTLTTKIVILTNEPENRAKRWTDPDILRMIKPYSMKGAHSHDIQKNDDGNGNDGHVHVQSR